MATTTPTPHRDNLLGVCNALGEDFGFNPLFLRVALAVALMLRPEATLIGYAIAGLLVVASRLMTRRRPASRRLTVVAANPAPVEAYIPERLAA